MTEPATVLATVLATVPTTGDGEEETTMTKRYRERLEEVELVGDLAAEDAPGRRAGDGSGADVQAPAAFRWRGQRYRVLSVLGHWYEDEGWWQRGEGLPERIERTDLWRVEARNGAPTRGVYELVRRGDDWRLDRVWD